VTIGFYHLPIGIMRGSNLAHDSAFHENTAASLRSHGVRFHSGIAIPSKMLSPGQDGYRTPTGEDYEHHYEQRRRQHSNLGVLAPSLPHMHSPLSSATRSLSRGLEKLAWKQRLRHFTWTFFTMTMATGGIANVLHQGCLNT